MSTFTASKTVRNWKVNECSNKWSMHDFIAPIDGSSNVRLAPHQRLLWKFWFIQIKIFEKKTNLKLSVLSVKKNSRQKKLKRLSARKKKFSAKKKEFRQKKKFSAKKLKSYRPEKNLSSCFLQRWQISSKLSSIFCFNWPANFTGWRAILPTFQ